MNGREWTEAECAELARRFYAGETDQQIAEALSRPTGSVHTKRVRDLRLLRQDHQIPAASLSAALGTGGYWARIKTAERRHSRSLKGHRFEDEPGLGRRT